MDTIDVYLFLTTIWYIVFPKKNSKNKHCNITINNENLTTWQKKSKYFFTRDISKYLKKRHGFIKKI